MTLSWGCRWPGLARVQLVPSADFRIMDRRGWPHRHSSTVWEISLLQTRAKLLYILHAVSFLGTYPGYCPGRYYYLSRLLSWQILLLIQATLLADTISRVSVSKFAYFLTFVCPRVYFPHSSNWCEPDLEQWFLITTSRPPSTSGLITFNLNSLSPTPAFPLLKQVTVVVMRLI